MKKLSLLIALILCATIGAVYAGWAYNDPTKTMTADEEIFFTMDAAKQEGTQGTIEIVHNFKMKIVPLLDKDPSSTQANANHTTALQFCEISEAATPMADDAATITITFKPNASADGDVKQNGPNATYYFKSSADMKYDGNDIFSYTVVESAPQTIDWGEPNESGVFTVVLKAADFISIDSIYLSDIAEFNTYRGQVLGKTVMLYVNEVAD